jgi:hypothetical protein
MFGRVNMGAVKTRKHLEAKTRGYAQACGIAAAVGAWEGPRLFDADGQGVLPGMEEQAVRFRLRCEEAEEPYHFVLVDGLTFVMPLTEMRRLCALYPGVSPRDWELWAAREFSRALERAFEASW